MVNLDSSANAANQEEETSSVQSQQQQEEQFTPLPPRPSSSSSCCCCKNSYCCPGYRRQRRLWSGERIAQFASNLFVMFGTMTALIFAIVAIQEVTQEYIVLTIFIVGGTLFGGGCLLALVNVSWLSRRPNVRVSAIQVICNIVLLLITSYLELLFWPYPKVAYSILFTAGVPMLVMINLPSCFVKKYPDFTTAQEGDTVCLDQDAVDDATIVDGGDGDYDVEAATAAQSSSKKVNNNNNETLDDETQRMNSASFRVAEDPASTAVPSQPVVMVVVEDEA